MPPTTSPAATVAIPAAVIGWYRDNARELPWRAPQSSPWAVMVSEFMLQQTPVARVEPVYRAWMQRWPTVAACAAAARHDIIRAWGRLGYPRRALRLHASANLIIDRYGGEVPASYAELITLPGVGDYTAAAISSFAFGNREVVLDTNIRRVLARAIAGQATVTSSSPTRAERERAAQLIPDKEAATWSAAVMELGAVICTARAPACDECPIQRHCAWRQAGQPPSTTTGRKAQPWAGTDRMVRGKLMAVLREAPGPVTQAQLDLVWDDAPQRSRSLASLIQDGLVIAVGEDSYALPD